MNKMLSEFYTLLIYNNHSNELLYCVTSIRWLLVQQQVINVYIYTDLYLLAIPHCIKLDHILIMLKHKYLLGKLQDNQSITQFDPMVND